MADKSDLVLLVLAVAFVNAGGCSESITLGGHAWGGRHPSDQEKGARLLDAKDVLLNEHDRRRHELPLSLDSNLHSPERRLIELRMEHADLNALIDRASIETPVDELMMRRLKKRRLALRDQIARLELALDPKEPA